MLLSRCQRVLLRATMAGLALGTITASSAVAKPRPGTGFRLLASALAVFQTNRVQCRVGSDGQICATGSSTVGGGIWPKGSADQYVFASGVQIAGVIEAGPKSENGFAGDTAGAMFYNTSTGSGNGVEVRPIFSSTDPVDVASWPAEARVPQGDPSEELFDPTLRGTVAASEGDRWFVYWEGDPGNLTFRTHPLGILVETRSLAWNFPSGNEDILYFIYTFYNVTSTNEADYAYIRPSLRPLITQKARDFQALNTAKYGINLPAGGYSIRNLFVSFVADMDVAQADADYASVNVPFALGYTYEHNFSNGASLGWTFDPAIFGSAPFFPGVGFVGTKFLKSPINPATGKEVGLTLFGTFSRSSGSLQDPNDDRQLYRYITGGLLPTDGSCSLPNALEAHICFVNIGSPADMRTFQSSGPFDLGPGQSGSVVIAMIFAPPVAAAGCPGPGCDVKPATSNGNLNILGDATRMAQGVNPIDTITGYRGFTDVNGDGIVTQDEFVTQPGSLLGKARIAQSVFDTKFLLPFSPERPEFFLVPGDNQVTVIWAKSPTETNPDPFFAVAHEPLKDGAPNPLYDPNFRDLDVEGYRVYRGRTSNPSELTLIAQYDKIGSLFQDFRGTVNPTPGCAPELGVNSLSGCGVVLSTPAPGQAFTEHHDVDLKGTITQVKLPNRVLLANGNAQILPGALDTAFVQIGRGTQGAPARVGQGVSTDLVNSGIPFLFIDKNVRNGVRYFYTVTAFDINSLASGPSSLESGRVTKAVTPAPSPSNSISTGVIATHVVGRGVATDTIIKTNPTIDPATGIFSGPARPANGGVASFVGQFAASVIRPEQSGEISMRLDSITMGQVDAVAGFGAPGTPVPTQYFVTLRNPTDSIKMLIPFQQTIPGGGPAPGTLPDVEADTTFFDAITVDPNVATKFEGSPPFQLLAQSILSAPNIAFNGGWGIGCRFRDFGNAAHTDCMYNGSRWFDGPSPAKNETKADPNGGNCRPNPAAGSGPLPICFVSDFNNAGQLTGVTTIQQALSYINFNGQWRNLEWALPTVRRAADYNVYWGDGGKVDSVIDVSHNVEVPFSPTLGATWGILNATGTTGEFDARPAVVTLTDLGCVNPFFNGNTQAPGPGSLDDAGPSPGLPGGRIPCTAASAEALSNTAQLNQVAFFQGALLSSQTAGVATDGGFLFYLVGDVFLMAMPQLPPSGTVWALRAYTGFIRGGKGVGGGNTGATYRFTRSVSPFTAVGATIAQQFSVTSQLSAATKSDLSNVHTVPDPYYVRSTFESSTDQKVIKFVNLPQDAIIRIYSSSGVLVRMLEHHGGDYSSTSISQGDEIQWDLRNRNNQVVASGVYFFHVEAGDARKVGRFTVVNFAQ